MGKYKYNPLLDIGLDIAGTTGAAINGPVTNYAALPAVLGASGQYWEVLNSQGTAWLPGAIGGTYYPNGLYYSDGISWHYSDSPYQATQAAVDAGIITNQFVSPFTFKNSPLSVPAGTLGSVAFWGASGLTQDNTNFFWDNTLKKLSTKSVALTGVLSIVNSTNLGAQMTLSDGTNNWFIGSDTTSNFTGVANTFGIGTSALGAKIVLDTIGNFTVRSGQLRITGGGITGNQGGSGVANYSALYLGNNSNAIPQFTSGAFNIVEIGTLTNNYFAPSSGNATFNLLRLAPNIVQSGTAIGTVRGLYIDAAIGSLLGTYNAIESTSGNWVIGGSTNTPALLIQNNGSAPLTALSSTATGILLVGSGFTSTMIKSTATNADALLYFANSTGTARGYIKDNYSGSIEGAGNFVVGSGSCKIVMNNNGVFDNSNNTAYYMPYIHNSVRSGNSVTGTSFIWTNGSTNTNTTGTRSLIFITNDGGSVIQPTSGNANWNYLNINVNNIAQTGSTGEISLINLNTSALTSVTGKLYGLRSQLAASPTGGGTAYNIYADGTAGNYFGGNITISTATTATPTMIKYSGTGSGALDVYTGVTTAGYYVTQIGSYVSSFGFNGSFYLGNLNAANSVLSGIAFDVSSPVTGINKFSFLATAYAPTSGSSTLVTLTQTFNPTSGNATFSFLNITGGVNQTVTANGIVRGVYYAPTVTSILGTHYAWESTSGDMLVGGTGRYLINDGGTAKIALSLASSGVLGVGVSGMILKFLSTNVSFSTNTSLSFQNLGVTQSGDLTWACNDGIYTYTADAGSTKNFLFRFGINSNYTGTGDKRVISSYSTTFAPTTGSAAFTFVYANPIINQTGTANGNVAMFEAVPTITSVKANIFGFKSSINSSPIGGGVAYNIYADGTAPNKFGGTSLQPINPTAKTTNYTATLADYTVLCDATAAGFTVNLPTAASFYEATTTTTGGILIIKKIDASLNVVTIDGNSTETIDGSLTQALFIQSQSIILQSDGTSWRVLSGGTKGRIIGSVTTYNNADVTFGAVNTATPILFNTNSIVQGALTHSTSVNTSRITTSQPGILQIIVNNQVYKGAAGTEQIYFWFRKNGVDIADSGYTMQLNNGENDVFVINSTFNLAAGDYIEAYASVTNTGIILDATVAIAPVPLIPSTICDCLLFAPLS